MAHASRKPPGSHLDTHALVSVEDYLTEELGAATKCEFVNGYVFAMAGTTDWHNMVTHNLIGALNTRLPDRCRALGLDVKLQVKTQQSEHYYYPDAFVSCGDALKNVYVHGDALLVAEVLSPTTERFDRGEKMLAYRGLASLQDYLLVWPDAPVVEHYRRGDNWQRVIVREQETLHLPNLKLSIPVPELFRRVPVNFVPVASAPTSPSITREPKTPS
jgi:Uma2 family endonuclease